MNCTRCNSRLPKNRSQCPSCHAWNHVAKGGGNETALLSEVVSAEVDRLSSGPYDKCFGGSPGAYGIVSTSVTLLGGAPGAGKSTLAIQLADGLLSKAPGKEVFYLAAEEEAAGVKARGERLRLPHLNRIRVPRSRDVVVEAVEQILTRHKPIAIIVDSIQALTGGDINVQAGLARAAKDWAVKLKAPVILVSQINKADDFAGSMALQHEVDATISFFEEQDGTRLLSTVKNRHGGANIWVRFMMTETGLVKVGSGDPNTGKGDDDDDG